MFDNKFIIDLYNERKNDISILRNRMKRRIKDRRKDYKPQFSDTEAEITFLLILYFKPKNIIEFSPCGGWSTSIMLDGLNINDNNGSIKSYDIINLSRKNVYIAKNVNWNLIIGDVKEQFSKWDFNKIDYLFIDSSHSRDFAINYVNNLLNPLLKFCKLKNKQILISVHDVFHTTRASKEGRIVINFLNENNIEYYTPAWKQGNYESLLNVKKKLGFYDVIHKAWNLKDIKLHHNSIMYFIFE